MRPGKATKMVTFLVLAVFVVGGMAAVLQREPVVMTGLDALESENLASLHGRRIGVITNHTGVNRKGTSVIDILHSHSKLKLVALFSPEHGIRGMADHGVPVASSVDEKTSLPIFSLYSDKQRRPTADALRGINTLVFDMQDVGTRFYTYVTTMAYAMEEAKKHDIQFVVLDRPNPINGVEVEGPILDKKFLSFVGYYPLPLRHGMTIGELALLFNEENKIGADLKIVKMKGWHRSYWYDHTGLLWTNPSPNIRSLTQATVYPGVEPLKDLGLSVGRGTDTPFEVFGAPWIDGVQLAAHLNARDLKGIRFIPVKFIPHHDHFAKQLCGGVNLIVTDRLSFQPVECCVEIASALYQAYPSRTPIEKLARPIGSQEVVEQIKKGIDPRLISASWKHELETFRTLRRKFLLYD